MQTLTVKLEQHTPLIHFQHSQQGATLRASEVKPKLDKFILTKLGDENYEIISDAEFQNVADIFCVRHPNIDFYNLSIEKQYYEIGKYIAKQKGWLVGKGEHSALDYKMSIRSKGSKNVSMNVTPENGGYYPDRENSLFMGNMGGRPEDEVLNFIMNDTIDITLCFKSDEIYNGLNVIIKQSICSFFIDTGFGNRSSKGFGSFTVNEIDGVEQSLPSMMPEWNRVGFCLVDVRNVEHSVQRRVDNDVDLKNALHDVFVIISKVWKYLKEKSNGNGRGGRDPRRVMLGMDDGLTRNEDRIPSCLSFRPVLREIQNGYKVYLYIVLNRNVMDTTQNDLDDFYDFTKTKFDWYSNNVRNATDDQLAELKRKWKLNYDVELL